MRIYNGCVHEGDYRARHGYTPQEYQSLKEANPDILITYFPLEGKFDACRPAHSYTSLGEMEADKMVCLREAVRLRDELQQAGTQS